MGVVSTFGRVDTIGIHDRDVATLHRGVVERVFGVIRDGEYGPTPQPLVRVSTELGPFRSQVALCVGRACTGTREDFVNTYRGRKRTIYEAASASLNGKPVERQDASGKVFVKVEKTNFTLKRDPAPRVIFPRDPRFNVEVGRRLKFIEHRVYSAIGKVFGGTTVCKGLNFTQRGELLWRRWRSHHRPVAVGLDMSRFDQHVSVQMLQYEHGLYNMIFRDAELARLLQWQLTNRGVGYCPDGKLRFVKRGTRGSGDMNTALGNCFIMCAMLWYIRTKRGLSFSLCNDGDDCAVIMPQSELHAFMMGIDGVFLSFGFQAKVDYITSCFERIEFCQCHPVFVDGHPRMVRNPRKALSSDICSTKFQDLRSTSVYLGAMGVCGGVLSSGVPVYQDFYTSMRRCGDTGSSHRILSKDVELGNYGFTRAAIMESSDLCISLSPVVASTRLSFWRAFGITPDEQAELEAHYRSVQPLTSVSPIDSLSQAIQTNTPSFLHWAVSHGQIEN